MASDLAKWCAADAGTPRLLRCLLAVSPAQDEGSGAPPLFSAADASASSGDAPAQPSADGPDGGMDALRALPNVSVVESRLTREVLEGELAPLRALGACRVVVSGPESFNRAVKEMLVHGAGLDAQAVTILEA